MTQAVWFSARLLFESLHPDEDHSEKIFEDRIVLLEAEDEEEASRKAKALSVN
jgi:hypothetical protein